MTNVYISLRTDDVAGTGTKADPYDGSSQAKFDALMQSFGPNTWIHLGPGTFLSNGGDQFFLKTGWTIQGAGRGVTTLKLAGHASNNPKHYNLTGFHIENVKIMNLTCDGNDEGYNWPAHTVVGGITITGNGLAVTNVEVINCYGDMVNGQEEFSIFLCGFGSQIGTNCAIRNCLTHDYAPGSTYTNGPMIAYCDKPLILNCTDDGSHHAFGFAGTTNALISGCTSTRNSDAGFYVDTGGDSNVTIEGNSFSSGWIPIQFNSQSAVENISILNNNLESSNSSGSGSAAIVLSGASGNNIVIKGNVFTYLGTNNSGLILNNSKAFTNLDVEKNSSNVGLVGAGGSSADITDVAVAVEGNSFNLPISSLHPASSTSVNRVEMASKASDTDLSSTKDPFSPSASEDISEASQQSDVAAKTEQLASKVSDEETDSADSSSNNNTKSAAAESIIARLVKDNPDAAADYVQSMPDGSAKENAVESLSEKWAENDPAAVAEWLGSLPADLKADRAYSALAGKWATNDSDKAAEWLSTIPQGSSRDAAIKSFSSQIFQTDPEEGLKWATSIGDSKAQQAQVADLLHKWMQDDPDNASVAVKNSSLPEDAKGAILAEQ